MSNHRIVDVHLLPRLVPPGALVGSLAVVIDVLRATTVMVRALDSGVAAIYPCEEIEDARSLASALSGGALLAGERGGEPIPGFDLGNSPAEFTREKCAGRPLVMTTSNGTRAILACQEAAEVRIGAFTNRAALIERLASSELPIRLVCAGTEGSMSLEDTLLAGAIVSGLVSRGWSCTAGAAVARERWKHLPREAVRGGPALARILAEGKGGRRVTELGRGQDIFDAADLDRSILVPLLERDPLRIVAGR